MSQRPGRFQPTRRDFLKLLGASAGCSLLSSCTGGTGSASGGGGGGDAVIPPAPTPNGYAFFRVFTPGDPRAAKVSALTPQIMLDDAGHIVFHAQHEDGSYGLYQLTMRYNELQPRVVDARRIAAGGDTLADGRIVSSVASVDVNRAGRVAAVLNFDMLAGAPALGPAAVFTDAGSGLSKIADYNDDLPGNVGDLGGDFGDVDIHENDDVMLVARYGHDGDSAQGLFLLPSAQESNARLLISSGQEVPQADGAIQQLGLVDLDDDGEYVLQAFGTSLMHDAKGGVEHPGSFVIHGNINRPASASKLLSVCPTLPLTRAAKSVGASPSVGTSLYGPRVGAHSVTAVVTESPDGTMRLLRNGVVIAQTGQLSPGGSVIETMTSAVVQRSGLTFYELGTDVGLELCAHNGQKATLLLSRGAEVQGAVIDTIAFGFHTTMTDTYGRIVTYVQMADGQESILLGIPV